MSEARRVEWFVRDPGGGTVYVPSGRRWIGPEQAEVLLEQVRQRYGVAEAHAAHPRRVALPVR